MPIVMVTEGATVASLGDSNDVRDRVELVVIFNKIWGSEVK